MKAIFSAAFLWCSVKEISILQSCGVFLDMFFGLYGDSIWLRGEFQVDIGLDDGTFARAAVPSGASTGKISERLFMSILYINWFMYLCWEKMLQGWTLSSIIHGNFRYIWSFGIERWGVWLPRKRCSKGMWTVNTLFLVGKFFCFEVCDFFNCLAN